MWEQLQQSFTPFHYLRIVDIAIVVLFFILIYRAVKGSIAVNLFMIAIGVYLLWRFIREFEYFPLTIEIINRIVSISLLALVVLFQPELRKFLINVGRRPAMGDKGFFKRFVSASGIKKYIAEEEIINETMEGVLKMIHDKTGGIIAIALSDKYQLDTNSGVIINGLVSSELILSIFSDDSPLKNGAVVIDNNQILAAGVTLPISNSQKISSSKGIRHRAAVGITEYGEVIAIVVSSQDGEVSFAKKGVLQEAVSLEYLKKEMYKALVIA